MHIYGVCVHWNTTRCPQSYNVPLCPTAKPFSIIYNRQIQIITLLNIKWTTFLNWFDWWYTVHLFNAPLVHFTKIQFKAWRKMFILIWTVTHLIWLIIVRRLWSIELETNILDSLVHITTTCRPWDKGWWSRKNDIWRWPHRSSCYGGQMSRPQIPSSFKPMPLDLLSTHSIFANKQMYTGLLRECFKTFHLLTLFENSNWNTA